HPENFIPGVQSLVDYIIGILDIHKGQFPETFNLLVPSIVVGTFDRIPVKTEIQVETAELFLSISFKIDTNIDHLVNQRLPPVVVGGYTSEFVRTASGEQVIND